MIIPLYQLANISSESRCILVTNKNGSKFLTGNQYSNLYFWTENAKLAYAFSNETEAIQFEDSPSIREFLIDEYEQLVWNDSLKNIYD